MGAFRRRFGVDLMPPYKYQGPTTSTVIDTATQSYVPLSDPAVQAAIAAGEVLPADVPPSRKALGRIVSVEDVRTTNATISTLVAWPLDVQTLYTARFVILAVDTGNGDCRVWHATATAKRLGAGALLVGSPTVLSVHGDVGSAAWALSADTSGNDFRVRVTGAAGRTVSWSLVGEVLRARPDGLVE